MAQCKSVTRNGNQCSRTALPNSRYCWQHDTKFLISFSVFISILVGIIGFWADIVSLSEKYFSRTNIPVFTTVPTNDVTITPTPEPDLVVPTIGVDKIVTLTFPSMDRQDSNVTSKGFMFEDKYIWDISVIEGVATGIFADMPPVSDFDFQIDLKRIAGNDDISYGVSFREGEAGIYDFYINDINKKFLLRMWDTKQYEYVIGWQSAEAINSNGLNTLKVIADGAKIQLYINNHFVGDIRHNGLTTGKVGISVALNSGQSATFEISNYQLILH